MPSPEMRLAMVEAPLGDDVFGDDPTTNRLMEVAAERMGKQAATFVPSGTMGNLIGVALGVDALEIAACADTVTFCLSKGLACPVGSIFCGSEESVDEARRWRKRLGGGMRQVGVLAAAGLIALDHMVDRLAEDHSNARTLAEGLGELPGVTCDLSRVQTNLVYFDLEKVSAPEFTDECTKRGLLSDRVGPRRMRFVTHYGIGAQDVQSALKICEDVLSA